MGRSASHAEIDYALGPLRKIERIDDAMPLLPGSGVKQAGLEQRGESERADSARGASEKRSAGELLLAKLEEFVHGLT
jgi:hypothetical protein